MQSISILVFLTRMDSSASQPIDKVLENTKNEINCDARFVPEGQDNFS